MQLWKPIPWNKQFWIKIAFLTPLMFPFHQLFLWLLISLIQTGRCYIALYYNYHRSILIFICFFFRISGDYLSLCHSGCSMLKCKLLTAQKMKFSIADLVTFTEEILNGKFHFLCNGNKLFLDTSNYNNYEKSKYHVSKVTLRLVFVPRYVMFLIYLLFIYGPRY